MIACLKIDQEREGGRENRAFEGEKEWVDSFDDRLTEKVIQFYLNQKQRKEG